MEYETPHSDGKQDNGLPVPAIPAAHSPALKLPQPVRLVLLVRVVQLAQLAHSEPLEPLVLPGPVGCLVYQA